MANLSWMCVTPETIHNCWKHSGILPQTEAMAVTTDANKTQFVDAVTEQGLSESLKDLKGCGALQATNTLSLRELLNPVGEIAFEQVSDADLFESIVNHENEDEAHGLNT